MQYSIFFLTGSLTYSEAHNSARLAGASWTVPFTATNSRDTGVPGLSRSLLGAGEGYSNPCARTTATLLIEAASLLWKDQAFKRTASKSAQSLL